MNWRVTNAPHLSSGRCGRSFAFGLHGRHPLDENLAVNAAWVGVIGTSAGAVIAGVTAVVTNALNQRGAQREREDRAEQAERARVFESAKALSDARRAAYAQFLADVYSFRDGLFSYLESATPDAQESALEGIVEDLQKKINELTIFGPPEVTEAANSIVRAFARLNREHIPCSPSVEDDVKQGTGRFVAAAGQAVSGINREAGGSSASTTAFTGEAGNG